MPRSFTTPDEPHAGNGVLSNYQKEILWNNRYEAASFIGTGISTGIVVRKTRSMLCGRSSSLEALVPIGLHQDTNASVCNTIAPQSRSGGSPLIATTLRTFRSVSNIRGRLKATMVSGEVCVSRSAAE